MKADEQAAARYLRQRGVAITEIAAELGVSKASVSVWVRDIALSASQRQGLLARRVTASEVVAPHQPAAVSSFLHPQFGLASARAGQPLHPTKAKGDASEAMALAAFVAAGLLVSQPFSENVPYDLVVDDCSRLARVQVKHGRFNEEQGYLEFSVRRASHYVRGGYTPQECHFFAVWVSALGTLYLVPRIEVDGQATPILRTSPARNGQTSGVRYAKDYEFSGRLPWPD